MGQAEGPYPRQLSLMADNGGACSEKYRHQHHQYRADRSNSGVPVGFGVQNRIQLGPLDKLQEPVGGPQRLGDKQPQEWPDPHGDCP
ncbi:hypothetical protein D3C75_883720 [compost metagenome]